MEVLSKVNDLVKIWIREISIKKVSAALQSQLRCRLWATFQFYQIMHAVIQSCWSFWFGCP